VIERCAGAVVFDGARRLLVVRRRNDPGRGLWSVPGGRCRAGESTEVACVREVAEETGMVVAVGRELGRVERDGPAGIVYDITDYVCEVVGGELQAGDDADEVRWVTRAQLAELTLVDQLRGYLTELNLLPD
jgi:ADP-ribose pyrophosphatase YjhB (NUDIX family)